MSPQAGWILQEEVVPRLRSVIPRTVNCVGCEDSEELVQDATAIAAKMFHGAEAAGKTFTSGNIAYYAIQHLKSLLTAEPLVATAEKFCTPPAVAYPKVSSAVLNVPSVRLPLNAPF